jgi:predicted  nucleic acid-binding Zn-ribbon protein
MVLFMFLYARYSQYDTEIRNKTADLEEAEEKVELYIQNIEQEIKEKQEELHDLEQETSSLREKLHNGET